MPYLPGVLTGVYYRMSETVPLSAHEIDPLSTLITKRITNIPDMHFQLSTYHTHNYL